MCAQRAPLGPSSETQCSNWAPQVNNLLNQSEYEVGKEKASKTRKKQQSSAPPTKNCNFNTEFEFADDAISLNTDDTLNNSNNKAYRGTHNPYLNVNGKEELPCVHEIKQYKENISNGVVETSDPTEKLKVGEKCDLKKVNATLDGNYNAVCIKNVYSYCTLPKNKRFLVNQKVSLRNCFVAPPKRVTPDGTHIYYWCDLHKKCNNGKLLE